jgi:hypothetical protein
VFRSDGVMVLGWTGALLMCRQSYCKCRILIWPAFKISIDCASRNIGLPTVLAHCPGMFAVTEKEAAVIRAAFEQRGELSAAIELRRLFPGISDNVQARQCVRVIAGRRSVSVKRALGPVPERCPQRR